MSLDTIHKDKKFNFSKKTREKILCISPQDPEPARSETLKTFFKRSKPVSELKTDHWSVGKLIICPRFFNAQSSCTQSRSRSHPLELLDNLGEHLVPVEPTYHDRPHSRGTEASEG